MKKRKNITSKLCLLLLFFAALAMIVLPLQAWAAGVDDDNDGILNTEDGLCLPLEINGCAQTYSNIQDLFAILERSQPSLLPDNPFEFINDEQGVFNISVHEISDEIAPDQKITTNQDPAQYAVKLTEDVSTNDGDLGTSQIGIPAQKIHGRVFSQRIWDDVINACSQQDSCEAVNSAGQVVATGNRETGYQAIFDFYAKNVVAHETFHMLDRVVPADRKVDNHYPELGYIMDHHMVYKVSKKEDKVIWYITNKWSVADKPLFKY